MSVTGVRDFKIPAPSYWNVLRKFHVDFFVFRDTIFQDTNPELLERLTKVSCRFFRFYNDTSIWIIFDGEVNKASKIERCLSEIY